LCQQLSRLGAKCTVEKARDCGEPPGKPTSAGVSENAKRRGGFD